MATDLSTDAHPVFDEDSFARECERRRTGLYAYALTCCHEPHLAEDIVQETMLIATQKRTKYLQEYDFGLWLASIACNVWFRERKRKGINQRRLVPEPVEEMSIEMLSVPTEVWSRELDALRLCMTRLNDEDRNLLQRHFTDEQNYDSVATAMQQSLSWVKIRMHRLRKSLLDCVRRRLSSADHV